MYRRLQWYTYRKPGDLLFCNSKMRVKKGVEKIKMMDDGDLETCMCAFFLYF